MLRVMLYALIGSLGAGGILFVLWRKAKAEARAKLSQALFDQAVEDSARWQEELADQQEAYRVQLDRRDSEIQVLKAQRKQALDALEKSSSPGSLRTALRMSLGVPDPEAPTESKPEADHRP